MIHADEISKIPVGSGSGGSLGGAPMLRADRPRGSPRIRSLVAATLLIFVVLMTVAMFLIPHARLVGLALLIPAVTLAVAANRVRAKKFDYVEVLFPFSLLYFLYFGVGAIYLTLRPGELRTVYLAEYLLPALGVTVVGYLAFVFAYTTFLNEERPSAAKYLVPRGVTSVWLLGSLGFAGALAGVSQTRAVLAGLAVSSATSALQQCMPVFFFAWALAWFLFFGRSGQPLQRWAGVLGLLPMAAAIALLTIGGKSLFLTIVGLPALAYWYARRKLPVKTLVVVLLIAVFVVFPLYNTFRLQSRNAATFDRLEGALRAADRWDRDDYLDRSVYAFLKRMSLISSVAAVVRETGRWVDYRYGETLILAPISVLIPRFLWPDKPNVSIGREFGVTFDLVNPVDKETQIATTVVGEFYWNFHVPGVLVGMFLLGLAYKWFYVRYGAASGGDPVRAAIYIALLAKTLQFEGNFAMLVGGFVKTLVILHFTVFLLRRLGFMLKEEGPAELPA